MAFLGTRPPGVRPAEVAPNHSNRMVLDEGAMATGVALYAAAALRRLVRAARPAARPRVGPADLGRGLDARSRVWRMPCPPAAPRRGRPSRRRTGRWPRRIRPACGRFDEVPGLGEAWCRRRRARTV